AVDVDLDGNGKFDGPGELNQTVQTVTLINNQPVTITLNALPTPLRSTYAIQARVIDSIGNQGTSGIVIMQGPKPDTVTLTVPTTLTPTNNTAVARVTVGQGNQYPATINLAVGPSNSGVFQQQMTGNVNSAGVASFPLSGLASGTYKLQASFT